MKAYGAEFLGTFWLVLGGCGSAVLAAAFPGVGIGLHGVSLAFGLTVLTMAYRRWATSRAGISTRRCRSGLWAGGRFPAGQLLPYIVSQVLGAASWLLARVLYTDRQRQGDGFRSGRRFRVQRLWRRIRRASIRWWRPW